MIAGTRGSLLALTQTETVCASLKSKNEGLDIRTVTIKTTGDKILDVPLSEIGAKSLFTKEIEEALLDKKIDFAVHSLKDLPTEIPKGLEIGAVLKRENPRDCIVSKESWTLQKMPKGARVGTSALRRQSQILAVRPDIKIENLRGNIDTRIRKLEEGLYDAVLLAQAGIGKIKHKLAVNWKDIKLNEVPIWDILPAVGQGFLAVEIRANDKKSKEVVSSLDDPTARAEAFCERAFLRALEGGCQVPIGAYAQVQGDRIALDGYVGSIDGKKHYREQISGHARDAEKIGRELAKILLSLGGDKILEAIRNKK